MQDDGVQRRLANRDQAAGSGVDRLAELRCSDRRILAGGDRLKDLVAQLDGGAEVGRLRSVGGSDDRLRHAGTPDYLPNQFPAGIGFAAQFRDLGAVLA